jgi:hypothetical protein
MSGTTTNAPNTTKNYDAEIFTGEKSEFGMPVFSDPHRQATYEHHETRYKKTYALKQAYDKQEFLRKMRTDIRREYMTRKKQVKQLQCDAAVDFRNAEMSLQEHYASASAQGYEPWRIHGVDICAPLVSQIQLPSGETLDLKTLSCDTEFAKVRGVHEDLRLDQLESIRIWEEEQQRQREYEATNEASWNRWTQQQYHQRSAYEPRSGAFGGCYDEEHYPDEHDNGNNDNGNDSSSYDSEYDGIFPDYPREYNYEREIREAEEARLQQQNKRPSHVPGCVNPRCVSCCCDNEVGYEVGYENNAWSDDESEPEEEILDSNNKWNLPMTEEEKTILENGEEAERQLEECPEDLCVSGADVTISRAERMLELLKERAAIEEQKAMEIPDCPPIHDEPAPASASTGGGMISAQKKAAAGAAAKAAKARQVKQQQKKQQKKFVPLQVTDNTNRANEVTAILTANKLEINLPKKKLLNATREAKKRHNQKWNHTNTECKQIAARGTRISNIPEPRFDGDYSD